MAFQLHNMSALQGDEELGELTAEERAAIDAAHASAVAAGVAPMDVSRIEMFDACCGQGASAPSCQTFAE